MATKTRKRVEGGRQPAAEKRPRRRKPRRAGRPRASAGAVLSREAILEGALEAFATAGYEAMSVRELTRRLGVSHNLVHHYFRSKMELWRACIDHSFGTVTTAIAEALQAAPAETDVVRRMREVYALFVTLTARYPANGLIIAREGALGGPRLDYIFERHIARAMPLWMALFEEAKAEGRLRPDADPRTLFFLLTDGGAGPFTSQALAKRIGGPDLSRPEVIRAHAELVADVLISGVTTD